MFIACRWMQQLRFEQFACRLTTTTSLWWWEVEARRTRYANVEEVRLFFANSREN